MRPHRSLGSPYRWDNYLINYRLSKHFDKSADTNAQVQHLKLQHPLVFLKYSSPDTWIPLDPLLPLSLYQSFILPPIPRIQNFISQNRERTAKFQYKKQPHHRECGGEEGMKLFQSESCSNMPTMVLNTNTLYSLLNTLKTILYLIFLPVIWFLMRSGSK